MTPSDSDMLTQAIERNSAAVLALPSAGMVRYHKTRFLRHIDERIWLEGVPSEKVLIESLVQDGQLVVVSFKTGACKVNFSSSICCLDCNYRFFDTVGPLQAIEMRRPQMVKPVQRRSHYRVPVREADYFTIQLWRIAEQVSLDDEPPDRGYLPAKVCDLSVGGVGVIFPSRPLLIESQRVRILLKHDKAPPMLIEGRSGQLRQIRGSDTFETGIQFQHLQSSLAGRRMLTDLTKIVQNLQLEEMKRQRGVAG